MIEKPEADHDPDDGESSDNSRGSLGYLQGVAVAAIWVFILLLLGAIFWPNLTERTKFFTGHFFNLLIAFAVIAQVLIYRKQWRVMERQSKTMDRSLIVSSRAYVGVRSIKMDREAKTVLVEIENVGNIPAEQITLFLQLVSIGPVEFDEGNNPVHQDIQTDSVREDYGRTKLFKGNLPILLTFHLGKWAEESRLIEGGDYSLIVRGYIDYADGFSISPNERTDFYFNYLPGMNVWSAGPPEYGDMIGGDDEEEGS